MYNFGKILKELRKKKKLSQAKLAKETGLTRQAISLYEIGKREPKLETWVTLADFFDVPVSYLQGLSEINYRDENALRQRFNSSDLAKSIGLKLGEKDKGFIEVSELQLMQRDETLTSISRLKKVLFQEISSISSEEQYKQLSNKFDELSEKQANTLLFEMTMIFVLSLQDGNEKIKDLLYQISTKYYDKHFR